MSLISLCAFCKSSKTIAPSQSRIEREIIPFCQQHGISQVVYSPLAQGVLTGKYKSVADLPAGSRAVDPQANRDMGSLLTKERLETTGKL